MSRKKKQRRSARSRTEVSSVAEIVKPANARPHPPEVDQTLGEAVAHHKQGRLAEAAAKYEAVLRADRYNFDARHLLGVVRYQEGELTEAVSLIAKALELNGNAADAHFNLGNALKALKRLDEAVESYRRALEIRPDHTGALTNLGNALTEQSHHEEAISYLRRAIEIEPNLAQAHDSMGNALKLLKRPEEAAACYRQAIEASPEYAEAHYHLGNALRDLKRYEEAIDSLQRALELKPEHRYALGALAYAERHLCAWNRFDERAHEVVERVRKGEAVVGPFVFLSYSADPQDQLLCAQSSAREVGRRIGTTIKPLFQPVRKQAERIRIGYLSADLHRHATAYLMAELFELHDREKFEVYAFSYGPEDGSAIRQRLEQAFDSFLDVRGESDEEVASRIADLDIDILIDLKGYTKDCRPGILAYRPAPIQVNYLGFPGTMGADFIDYIVVDPFVVPADQQRFFTEKLVHLPDCYQVNDSTREIAEQTPSRGECGLPEDGFVFCCFNNNYKITPVVFDVWMRLLKAVPGSVLWLLRDTEAAERNLRHEAQARGVDPRRLVFAPRRKLPQHLARHRVADLFLDTLPYNAHTTASDALWVGLPVLTCVGQTFSGRVAGSLLHAVRLPELVTNSLDEYEALAIKLAREPELLQSIREKLTRNLVTALLFDTDRFRRHIEAAYTRMWEIWERGEGPRAITIEAKPAAADATERRSATRTSGASGPGVSEKRKAAEQKQSVSKTLAQAVEDHKQGKLSHAATKYQAVLEVDPDHFDALHLLGVVYSDQGNYQEAVALIRKALKRNPGSPFAHNNLGNALRSLKRPEEAIRSLRRALELKADFVEAHNNLGIALADVNQHEEAVRCYRHAIELRPGYSEAYYNLANALRSLGRDKEAIAHYRRALEIKPNYADAHSNLGNALRDLKQYEEAVACYRRALEIRPASPEVHNNLGSALRSLGRQREAILSFQRAVEARPDCAEAHNNLGVALADLSRYDEAVAAYRRAVTIQPDLPGAVGTLALTQRRICDWAEYADTKHKLAQALRSDNSLAASPFTYLVFSGDAEEQLKCAKRFSQSHMGRGHEHLYGDPSQAGSRVRLGYLSADFREHPVAFLMAELFERHDREKFEIYAFSFGQDDGSAIRRRLERAFDHFIDVSQLSDAEVARQIAELSIHIAIDLMGYTRDSRPGILGYRPAPVQVNYLGYPGTMGADFIDYILVDPYVVPADQQVFFAEKLVHLPDCYQVTDSTREIAEDTPTRAECGLPEDGFVFCCFNNNYKITPLVFDVWMRLLKAVPGSVMWLFVDNETAMGNLRREVRGRKVDPDRLIFAPHRKYADYLARYRVADLFLDTLPYNAGTTASDALWAGLPVLTCAGHTFASRMAGSLLRAVGLPELVTNNLEEYEALALKLANEPELLQSIREKLARNRETAPLFDTDRFRRHIEAAYTQMWATWEQGDGSQPITIEAKPAAKNGNEHKPAPPIPGVDGSDALRQGKSVEPAQSVRKTAAEAVALHKQDKLPEAAAKYKAVLEADGCHFDALHLLGVIRYQQGRNQEAVELIRRALQQNPDSSAAHYNLGVVLQALRQNAEAIESYRRALELKSDYAAAHNNLGNIYKDLAQFDKAMACYRRALEIRPGDGPTHHNLGVILDRIQQYQLAVDSYRRAVELKPDYLEALSGLAHAQRYLCDWSQIADMEQRLRDAVGQGCTGVSPLSFLSVSDDPEAQLSCARLNVQDHFKHRMAPRYRPDLRAERGRIRLGYLSADLRKHAVAFLMAGLFERHDREKFEVFAFSFGRDDGSAMRHRLEQAFDHFIDVRGMSDDEVADRIVELGIHITIDLTGHTAEARTGVLARRPAPVQVNYLGFPGTMGADFIDYILVDPFVVPADQQPFFIEKLVHLPDCFQVNDSKREIAEKTPSRGEFGLPEDGFVFCCFNNIYKITPAVFDIWMRLLGAVPGSVLWLVHPDEPAEANLRREAQARGVSADRLVFAPRTNYADYLARYGVADLFLDTLLYNAGTTASDALWAGLPVLTCAGQTFASRMAGSLLHAVGLPELVTDSLHAYEALALKLATDREFLVSLRDKLARNRASAPLFDTDRFRRHIEAAYREMWEVWQRGDAPHPFAVEPLKGTGQQLEDLRSSRRGLDASHEAVAQQRPAMLPTTLPADEVLAEAVALHQQGKLQQAEAKYQAVLDAHADHFDALHLLGVVRYQQGNVQEAVRLIEEALERNPNAAEAHYNLGVALSDLKRYEAAIRSFRRALEVRSDYAEAYNGLGAALRGLKRYEESVASYRRALEIQPDYAQAQNNLGIALGELRRREEAITSYQRALEIRPDYAEAHYNLGIALSDLKRYEEAIRSFRRVLEIQSDHPRALSVLTRAQSKICDWTEFRERSHELSAHVQEARSAILPFGFLAFSDDPKAQLLCAQHHIADLIGNGLAPVYRQTEPHRDRIRLGYLSADFHEHATAYLMAELFDLHDRGRFEIFAFSYGRDDDSSMRRRLRQAFDRFIDVRQMSDEEVARQIADLGIDILIDLKGYTQDCRPVILAYRPAPVQVNYLGFPGTMGADFIDYILVDPFVVPADQQPFFTEKLVHLPDCYQVNDSTREIAEPTPSRGEYGLPEDGFVFCCFNNTYKITPFVFDVWMRLLKAVPGSVLWLIGDTAVAERNLRHEAQARGVDPQRLVFAPRRKLPKHLARHRTADLFLDTLPYNAHTTASDALWAGLPVLTCAGRTFAGRVAGSLLHAVKLPELVTNSLEDYESLALKLANESELLQSIREKLTRNRETAPLFDTDRFRRHIEAAYTRMWEIWEHGEGPRAITIEAEPVAADATERRVTTKTSGTSGSGIAEQRTATEQKQSVRKTLAQAVEDHKQGKLSHAATKYQAVLEVDPDHFDALHLLGVVYSEQGNYEEAVALIQKAVKRNPRSPFAHNNLGNALRSLKRPEEAIESLRRALELKADFAEAHNNLGIALADVKRHEEAVRCYRRAIELRPGYTEANYNLAKALRSLGRDKEAIAHYRRALEIKPDWAEAHYNLGLAFADLSQYDEAITSYRRAVAIRPDLPGALGTLALIQRRICDWSEYTDTEDKLAQILRSEKSLAASPFTYLVFFGDAEEQLKCAQRFSQSYIGRGHERLYEDSSQADSRVRLGYLSADFREHPLAFLMAELFERHDREKFEVFAFSFGRDDGSAMRRRLERAFDHFIDVCQLSDAEVARQMAELGIHIAIDLMGYTRDSRPEVLAYRPAPVQVNYLGYPGTMGADFIDYILVDPFVVPADQQVFFTEKLVHLPDCYQVNDSKREIAEDTPTRVECGLPEDGFVFCCFNNNYKITPVVFDIWMRLLKAIPGSVLWLFVDNETAMGNLRREVRGRKVDPDRLIFAPHRKYADYLARYRVADLFLDTLPYNAGTTASDALWAGLPVLTCAGRTFTSRMAGSLLHAVGMPELVTNSLEEYEALAKKLANESEFLQSIREKLARNRAMAPLFDADRFRRHIETAYCRMWEIWEREEGPRAITIEAEPEAADATERRLTTKTSGASSSGVFEKRTAAEQTQSVQKTLAEAVELHNQGKLPHAAAKYQIVLEIDASHFDALHYLGVLRSQQGRKQEAVDLIRKALQQNPNSAEAYYNLGLALHALRQYEEATSSYRHAVMLKTDYAEAHNNLGNALKDLKQFNEAVASYRRALAIRPNDAGTHNNLGVALNSVQQYEEAIASYRRALELKPDYAEAHNNLGNALKELNQLEEAVACYRRALGIQPDYASAHNNLGIALKHLTRYDEAVSSYREALRIRPEYAEAHHNLGNMMMEQKRYEEAATSYRHALAQNPDHVKAFSSLAHAQRHLCDWSQVSDTERRLLVEVGQGRVGISPLSFLSISDDPQAQLLCAQLYVREHYDLRVAPRYRPELRAQRGRIRLGYLSADLREHAVAFLMAELFELHDREKFEIFAFSYGPADGSAMRHRLEQAFDHFIDVRRMSDAEVAERMAELGIHITIDLTGHTGEKRTGIMARRPAPVQVNYLGFPGTMGADFIDYILVDPFVVPADQQPFFAEKLVHLPDCFQVNDNKREIAGDTPTRVDCGLPEHGFVFCCFNNTYKITPAIFDVWMRLLGSVPDSVLWLVRPGEVAAANLCREAQARGISADRLVFARRAKYADYLAGYRMADLFLDTLPYNAGTTASDALWAGLPVLTCAGRSFASRMAGSLLHAVGMPELVTHSLEEYEALALNLATDRELLESLREKLTRNRASAPLFDTDRFRRHIETAYMEMWEIWQSEATPRAFAVASQTGPSGSGRRRSLTRQSRTSHGAAPKPPTAVQGTPHLGQQLAKAVALYQQDKQSEAEALCEAILQADSNHFDALHLLGVVRAKQGKHEAAVTVLRKALERNPNVPEAHNNLGNALRSLKRHAEAIVSYRRALELRSDFPEAHNNLGTSLRALKRAEEAMASYRRALEIRPDYADAYSNLGNALVDLKEFEEAIGSYRCALEHEPDHRYGFSMLSIAQRRICDWTDFADTERELRARVQHERTVIDPFGFLAFSADPEQQLRCARMYVEDRIGWHLEPLYPEKITTDNRIRIAYLSADFREHAAAYLTAGLFERHDRERFEVFAFSFGTDDRSAMRRRLERAFDHFIDVGAMSDVEVAQRMADLGIQVAIDLMGYTKDARPEILARRPAPVQVNYLGYPGTMGADFIDYVLVDPFVVPADQQPFFAEKLVHLPDCFQVNDSKREIAEDTPKRADFGLPEHGFVFCCFNNSYKITPAIFDVWMRLLGSIHDSVLWLVRPGEVAEANLRREARVRGVKPERLVFARRAKYADYLAGYRMADLFLDTLPYNAGTTASDALWAGLPVLTCAGRTFASRMAGSLLHAVRLPELVTNSLEDYEALAKKLAKEPELLQSIREKLARNRETAPLFDTDRFRRHIEAAYTRMWKIWERGDGSRPFAVSPQTRPDGGAKPQRATRSSVRFSDADSHRPGASSHMQGSREALKKAVSLQQEGDLSEAAQVCEAILEGDSGYFDALHLLGVVRAKQGDYEGAVTALEMATTRNSNVPEVYNNLGSAYSQLKRPQEAAESYRRAITLQPECAESYSKLGIALNQIERNEEAIGSLRRAIEIQPDFAEANYNLACVLKSLKRFEEAIGYYKRALELAPDYAQAHQALGNLFMEMKRPEDAEASFRRAIEIEPTHADVHNNLGIAMAALERNEDAIASYRRALELKPNYAEAYYNLGNTLRELNRTEEAIANFRRAIENRQDFAQAYCNLGSALRAMKRYDEAVSSYREALRIRPEYAEAQHNLGNLMMELKRYEEAASSYRLVLAQNPEHIKALSSLAHAQRHLCDWSQVSDTERRLRDEVGQGRAGISPLSFLSVSDDPQAQLRCARLDVQEQYGLQVEPRYRPGLGAGRGRIRLGYLSADLRNHAVAFLMAGLFEQHDRAKFEVYAFSFGRDDGSAMRHRLEQAFDHFFDVRGMSDDEVADRIAELGIRIVIDLTGHTAEARTGILARRPAPVAVNYLGFPGTMGADFIDYILVDLFVVPADQQPFFAEKLVHLPDCFQVNDSRREIAEDTPTRAECGLPEDGFVFCCFNNTYKITQAVFDVWMRLLGSVPGSVLWLVGPGEVAEANLRREAQARGVFAERLVFASRTKYADYLARYRIADLFLDTLPFNAGTTASDALWAGLPVLTCAGRSFASRMAGSLLHAVGLPELVTESLEAYEPLALRLATEPALLDSIRERLARNRETAPLFDTDRFRRHIEAAYMQMWEIWVHGRAPSPLMQGG